MHSLQRKGKSIFTPLCVRAPLFWAAPCRASPQPPRHPTNLPARVPSPSGFCRTDACGGKRSRKTGVAEAPHWKSRAQVVLLRTTRDTHTRWRNSPHFRSALQSPQCDALLRSSRLSRSRDRKEGCPRYRPALCRKAEGGIGSGEHRAATAR